MYRDDPGRQGPPSPVHSLESGYCFSQQIGKLLGETDFVELLLLHIQARQHGDFLSATLSAFSSQYHKQAEICQPSTAMTGILPTVAGMPSRVRTTPLSLLNKGFPASQSERGSQAALVTIPD